MGKQFIPGKDALFDIWFAFLVQYVLKKCAGPSPAWTHIPPDILLILSAALSAWQTAFQKLSGPHTQVDIYAKNTATKTALALLRPFINQYLRFPPVTDEDRLAMGIPNKDTHPSPVNPPDPAPSFSIIQMGPGTLGIIYRDGEKGRKGSKPEGVVGARIYYRVSDTPLTDQEQLSWSKWATKCPHIIRFRESDRGKRVYFALKWEIRKENGESPWSEILSEIVP
jgi:hypothetical protein